MTDNKPHEPYGWSAYARSVADLMVGINMSRLFSCKNQTLLTIGRVQTPTLGLVVNRDLAIEGHHKQKYYTIACDINFNKKAVVLLQKARLQLPRILFQNNGFIYSIREKFADVNPKIEN